MNPNDPNQQQVPNYGQQPQQYAQPQPWPGQTADSGQVNPQPSYTQPYHPHNQIPVLPNVPTTTNAPNSAPQNSHNQSYVNRHKRSPLMIVAVVGGLVIAGIAAFVIFSLAQSSKEDQQQGPNQASQQEISPSDSQLEGKGTINSVE